MLLFLNSHPEGFHVVHISVSHFVSCLIPYNGKDNRQNDEWEMASCF